jgi:hypothetical protein
VLFIGCGPASQIIGLVRVENAIALFELGSGPEHESLAVRLGQSAVLLVSIGFYRWYLLALTGEEPTADAVRVPAL